MQRAGDIEAEGEQLLHHPVPHIEPAMHRIAAGAGAADQQPFEQNDLRSNADDETRSDERRRKIEERLRRMEAHQDADSRQERGKLD